MRFIAHDFLRGTPSGFHSELSIAQKAMRVNIKRKKAFFSVRICSIGLFSDKNARAIGETPIFKY